MLVVGGRAAMYFSNKELGKWRPFYLLETA